MNTKNNFEINDLIITKEIIETDILKKAYSLAGNMFNYPLDEFGVFDVRIDKVAYIDQQWILSNFNLVNLKEEYKDERILIVLMSAWVVNFENLPDFNDLNFMFSENYSVLYAENDLNLENQGVTPNEGMGGEHQALIVEDYFPHKLFKNLKFEYNRKPSRNILNDVSNELLWRLEERFNNDPDSFLENYDFKVPKLAGLKGVNLIIRKKERELIKMYLKNKNATSIN